MDVSDLPQAWIEQFDGKDLERKLAVSAALATTDAEGWPHISYLSAGEVLVQPGGQLVLALWPTARTTANIVHSGRAILHAAADGAVWETRLALQPREAAPDPTAIFDGRIVEVRRHGAPYAEVEQLIGFRLHAAGETLARWTGQIARMRAQPSD